MRLDRDGPTLELDIEVLAQHPNARTERLRFTQVSALMIEDFNDQNVLFDVVAARRADGRWGVTLESSYGLSGSFECDSIATVERHP